MWPDLPKEAVLIEGDAEATHFGAFYEDSLVGVASFFPNGARWRLRKLAVDPKFQRKRIASGLLEASFVVLRDRKCTSVWCDARVCALGFYHRAGFSTVGDVFEKNGLSYIVAERFL